MTNRAVPPPAEADFSHKPSINTRSEPSSERAEPNVVRSPGRVYPKGYRPPTGLNETQIRDFDDVPEEDFDFDFDSQGETEADDETVEEEEEKEVLEDDAPDPTVLPKFFSKTRRVQCALKQAILMSLARDEERGWMSMSDRRFRQRYWEPALDALNIGNYSFEGWTTQSTNIMCRAGRSGRFRTFVNITTSELDPFLFSQNRREFGEQLRSAVTSRRGITERKNTGGSHSGVRFFKIGRSEFFIKEMSRHQVEVFRRLISEKNERSYLTNEITKIKNYFWLFEDVTLAPRYLGMYQFMGAENQWENPGPHYYIVFSSVMMDKKSQGEDVQIFDIKTSRERGSCWSRAGVGYLGNFYSRYNPLEVASTEHTLGLQISHRNLRILQHAIDRDLAMFQSFKLADWSLLVIVREAPSDFDAEHSEFSQRQIRILSEGVVDVYPDNLQKDLSWDQWSRSKPQRRRLIYYLGLIDMLQIFEFDRMHISKRHGRATGYAGQIRHHAHAHYMGCALDLRFLSRWPGNPRLSSSEKEVDQEEIETQNKACLDPALWNCDIYAGFDKHRSKEH